jgi:hypothetical protein
MEPEDALPWSQEPANEPHSESVQPRPYSHTLSLEDNE